MKKILILGAGIYQVPLIKKAVKKNFYVITASWSKNDPGMKFAHENWVVDTRDKEKLLELAQQNKIDAVLTSGTDVAIPAIGYICDYLGLPGISYGTAKTATEKGLMQKQFKYFKVNSAQSFQARNMNQVKDMVKKTGFPVVLKAPDNSGSRGVFVVRKKEEIQYAFENALNISRVDYVLVEEYLKGIEFGAQAIVLNKKLVRLICFNDTLVLNSGSVPIGHSLPFKLEPFIEQETFKLCENAIASIGFENGVCNLDLIYDGKKVYMIEMGARAGGAGIPEIIKITYGIDLYDIALELALKARPEIKESKGMASAIRILRSETDGIIKHIKIDPELLEMSSNVSLRLDYGIGDRINRFNIAPDRIGDVIASASTHRQAEDLCRYAESCLELTLE